MNVYLIALLLYSLLLVGLGIFFAGRVKTISEFFVAGRKLGPVLLFSTMLAANIGAGSTVGAAGLGYRMGLSGWWWVGSAAIGSMILAFTVGPRIWALAERHDFLTVGDYLESRYNRPVRGLVTGLLWIGTLSILAGQLIAIAWILNVVAGTSKPTGCLLGGVVVVTYFAAGGLKGTAWINLLQLGIKGLGFALAVPLVLRGLGGWGGLQQQILSQGTHSADFFQITGVGVAGISGYLVLLVPSFIVSPGLLQKIYGARNQATVRLGTGAQGLVLFFYSFLPVVLGMAAAAAFPSLSQPELALPMVMTELLPIWLGALLLAAVFSAEVSSADAILFMLATSLSKDLYKTYLRPEATDARLLQVSRRVSVLSGVLGVVLAIVLPSVIDALSIFYGLMSVALFIPLILGLYTRFAAARSCLMATAAAVPATGLTHWITAGKGYGILSPVALGILISLLVMLVVRKREHDPGPGS